MVLPVSPHLSMEDGNKRELEQKRVSFDQKLFVSRKRVDSSIFEEIMGLVVGCEKVVIADDLVRV